MTIYRDEFPGLKDENFRLSSDPSVEYNCVAWAAGYNDEIWDPDEDDTWPIKDRNETIEAVVKVFESLGFTGPADESHELGFQKVAIYGSKHTYEHVARQLKNGLWTSKMGQIQDDICHRTLACIEGGSFGAVQAILKRPYPKEGAPGDDFPALESPEHKTDHPRPVNG